jgi:hypothetical protein
LGAATIITSNRAVDEWVALFDDPSSPTARWTASLTAPTRSSWRARASGPPVPRACRRTSGEPANRPLHGDSPRSKKGLAQATLMPYTRTDASEKLLGKCLLQQIGDVTAQHVRIAVRCPSKS